MTPIASQNAPSTDAVEPLVRIEQLVKYFPVQEGFLRKSGQYVHAVDGVDLEIRRAETLGLVGES